jgi:acyl-CoA synthetase (NDP forming)
VYIEKTTDAGPLADAVERLVSAGVQSVFLVGGRSREGSRMAKSHTGAVSSDSRALSGVFRQLGAVEVSSIHELSDALCLTGRYRVPSSLRLGLVSTSGGVAVTMADQVEDAGLTLSTLGAKTEEQLRQLVPEYAASSNPVDTTSAILQDSGLVAKCLDVLARDREVDVAIGFAGLMSVGVDDAVAATKQVVEAHPDKPIIVIWMGGDPGGAESLKSAGVLVFSELDGVMRCLSRFSAMPSADASVAPLTDPVDRRSLEAVLPSEGVLTEPEVYRVLDEVGIESAPWRLAADADEAAGLLGPLGRRLVVKGIVRGVLHKSASGLVRTGLETPEDVASAWQEIHAAVAATETGGVVLVQRQEDARHELLLGFRAHESLGPLLVVGSGGVGVEDAPIVAIRRLPLTPVQVADLVDQWRRMAGARISPAESTELSRAVTRFAALCEGLDGRLQELEVNPLLVGVRPTGAFAVAVDGVCVVDRPGSTSAGAHADQETV